MSLPNRDMLFLGINLVVHLVQLLLLEEKTDRD